mmetsp:Transcript_10731/g.17631  ORF Transcript_10731/g.17631 Transcript_10731/m.17631 type:complete len:221 (+) Transcript_10731:937-1599(+)
MLFIGRLIIPRSLRIFAFGSFAFLFRLLSDSCTHRPQKNTTSHLQLALAGRSLFLVVVSSGLNLDTCRAPACVLLRATSRLGIVVPTINIPIIFFQSQIFAPTATLPRVTAVPLRPAVSPVIFLPTLAFAVSFRWFVTFLVTEVRQMNLAAMYANSHSAVLVVESSTHTLIALEVFDNLLWILYVVLLQTAPKRILPLLASLFGSFYQLLHTIHRETVVG